MADIWEEGRRFVGLHPRNYMKQVKAVLTAEDMAIILDSLVLYRTQLGQVNVDSSHPDFVKVQIGNLIANTRDLEEYIRSGITSTPNNHFIKHD